MICHARSQRKPRGVVLVIVLVVVVLASLAGYAFLITMQTENKAAHGSARLAQLEAISRSGQESVAAWMESSLSDRSLDPSGPELFAAGVWTPIVALNGTVLGSFSFHVPNDSTATTPFESESSKLHLATLLALESQNPGAGREILMRIPGMKAAVADALLDWLDEDRLTRENGAEAAEYAAMGITIEPRNGLPMSLDELLFVRGMTRELLYGERDSRGIKWDDLVANQSGDPLESDMDFDSQFATAPQSESHSSLWSEESSVMPLPLSHYLTLCSAERNETFAGMPRINVNEANLGRLHVQLIPRLPIELADFIILYRQFGPAAGDVVGATSDSIVVNVATKPKYNIQSLWELLDAKVLVPTDPTKADSRRYVVTSPLSARVENQSDDVESLLDRLTVRKEPRILARIDLNTAPRPVLMAIPGVDDVMADSIIAGRATHDGVLWMLAAEVMNHRQLIAIAPYLARRGDVLRFRVKSRLGLGNMMRYHEVIWDASGAMAYQLDERELQPEFDLASNEVNLDDTTAVPSQVDTTTDVTSGPMAPPTSSDLP